LEKTLVNKFSGDQPQTERLTPLFMLHILDPIQIVPPQPQTGGAIATLYVTRVPVSESMPAKIRFFFLQVAT
jgi:hypothetical protein